MTYKKFYRSTHNKKIAGICEGLGIYFDIDPSILRIIWLCSVLFAGTGLIIYLIIWILTPIQ